MYITTVSLKQLRITEGSRMNKQNRAQSSLTMICKNAIHAGYAFSRKEWQEEQKRRQEDARKRQLYEVLAKGDKKR